MKSIRQIRENFDLITEKEEKEDRKLSSLVRAGLYDAKKLPALKKALDKSADKMTSQEKRMLLNLLDSLISQVTSDEQVYRKVKQNVHTINEVKGDYLSKFDPRFKAGYPTDKDIPTVIILKRKAIRVYPDNQKVALYYSQALDKYVTIPFNDIQTGLNEAKKDDDDSKGKIAGPRVQLRRRAIDAAHLLTKKGKYSSKIKRFSNLSSKVGKAGAAGVMIHDYFRKRAIKKALENKASKKTAPQSASTPILKKTVPSKPSAATQSNFQGKVRAMAQKSVVEQTYRQKLQQLREEREVNEIAPVIAAVGAAARVAAPWVARGAASLGGKILSKGKKIYDKWKNKKKSPKRRDLGVDLDVGSSSNRSSDRSSSNDRNQSNMPNYQFKASPEKYRAKGTSTDSAQRERERQLNRKSQQAMMKEDVLSTLKTMVNEDIKEQTVSINEQEININNTVAKKIVLVYESVNSKNKKKIEKMLNESAASFNKVLTFALRQ